MIIHTSKLNCVGMTPRNSFIPARATKVVSWCSWLSRQSNTLKVSGSNPGDANDFFQTKPKNFLKFLLQKSKLQTATFFIFYFYYILFFLLPYIQAPRPH